jgi:hypothetical protein
VVREPILLRSVLHDRETGVSLTMALIPIPFPHSLGQERKSRTLCRQLLEVGSWMTQKMAVGAAKLMTLEGLSTGLKRRELKRELDA